MDTSRAVTVPLLLLLFAGTATAASLTATDDSLSIGLGDERVTYLELTNGDDEQHTFRISASTTMGEGTVLSRIVVDGERTERAEVDVSPNDTRRIQAMVEGTSCPQTCTGSTTFEARSLADDERAYASVDISVNRDTDVYGAPGLSMLQLLVLAVLGAAAAARVRER